MGGKVAVGNGDLFTHFVFVQGSAVGTYNNAIITAGNIAIRNGDISAAIDVNTVVIGHIHSGKNVCPMEMDIITIADPITPAGGLVLHGNIFHHNIAAADEEDYTGRCQTGAPGVQRMGGSTDHGYGFV